MQGYKVKVTIFGLLIITLFSLYNHAGEKKIYSWKDKNGVLVFSDTPKPGAIEVKLTSQVLSMPTTDTRILNETKPTTIKPFKIEIASPENEQTVRENSGSVYVNTRVLPRFESDFKVQLFVDGIAHAKPSETNTFALRNVDRGEHSLQVKLFDPKGKLIAVSPISIFFMHRQSAL
ncbi:DUF4124 domain-containing protein [Pseudoalteromonas sp. H105]|jgi:hypothetical protein|uniref:DUF4124 domain-containing protein n=1 Tax=Pseudoalteromonas sp. H105 TaxID=1348393 RepID=UPI000732196E|nr:hypothetical protein ATS75_12670 [Pseudoalteromonas sp. H105]